MRHTHLWYSPFCSVICRNSSIYSRHSALPLAIFWHLSLNVLQGSQFWMNFLPRAHTSVSRMTRQWGRSCACHLPAAGLTSWFDSRRFDLPSGFLRLTNTYDSPLWLSYQLFFFPLARFWYVCGIVERKMIGCHVLVTDEDMRGLLCQGESVCYQWLFVRCKMISESVKHQEPEVGGNAGGILLPSG